MKARLNRLSLCGLGVALGAVLVSASAAWGQSSNPSIPPAMAGSLLMIVLVFGLASYVYMALALQTIAVKTNTANAWLGLGADCKCHPDVADRQEAVVVAHSLCDSHRQHRNRHYGVDGRGRSAAETKLVGDSGNRAVGQHGRARIFGLVRVSPV
jgi:hypothetical protein